MADDLLFGGYRGPGGFMPPATTLTEQVTNAAGSDLLAGEVVRLNGNATVTRAQADIPANVAGLVGVMQAATALGALGPVISSGRGFVLLEAALAPVAGDALWVSATVAGRATNVAPALAVYLGVIKDASGYGATGGVIADLAPNYALSTAFNTLHAAYNAGVVAADQEMIVTDAHGGGIVINATTPPPLYTGVTAFEIDVIGGSFNFYRVGGFDVSSMRTITAPVALSTWNANAFLASTLTLTVGGVAPTSLFCTIFEAPTITQTAGVAYVIPTAATVYIAGPPVAGAGGGGTPTLTATSALIVAGNTRVTSGALFVSGYGGVAAAAAIFFGAAATDYIYRDGATGAIALRATGADFTFTSGGAYGGAAMSIGIAHTSQTALKILATRSNIPSAAGFVWNGIDIVACTVGFTGNTGIATATGVNLVSVAAPTYNGNLAGLVIANAATVYISGPPIAGVNTTITNTAALIVGSGNVGIGRHNPGAGWATAFQIVAEVYSVTGYAAVLSKSTHTTTGAFFVQGNNSGAEFYIGTYGSANVGVSFGVAQANRSVLFSYQTAGLSVGTSNATTFILGTNGIARLTFGATGTAQFAAGQAVFSKQVLIGASPYTVDSVATVTDYCLEVQSNGGAITVNLPALTGGTQLNGRIIIIKDSGYNAAVSNITLVRGNAADKINNVAASYTINVSGTCLWLKANTTNNDWEIV